MAKVINLLSTDQNSVASYYYDNLNTIQYRDLSGDYQREVATAKTKIEEAAMWAVKALTNDIHVVSFNPSIKIEDKKGLTSIVKEGDYYFVSRVKNIIPAGQKTFEECEGKVINDYQQYLEENWVSDLEKEFTIHVNQDVFNEVKKEIKP